MLAQPALAVDRFVGPDDPYATLAEALGAALDGDTIFLRPGLHLGSVVVDVDVTILGLGGAAGTIVQSAGGAALVVAPEVVLGLEDLTLDARKRGRGLEAHPGSVLAATRVSIVGGAAASGAGMLIDGSVVTLSDVVLAGNVAEGLGGAVHVTGGGELTAVDGRWVSNQALSGGGLALESGRASLSELTLDRNDATDEGGAIWSLDALTLTNASLCANDAALRGGALAAIDGVSAVEATAFVDNIGGAVWADGSATLSNVTVVGTLGDAVSGLGDVSIANSIVAFTDGTGVVSGRSTFTLFYDNTLDTDGPLDITNLTGLDPDFLRYSPDGLCADVLVPAPLGPAIDAGDLGVLDPDGSRSDLGATGGPLSVDAHWLDGDGDGAPWLTDCDDTSLDRTPDATEVAGDGIDQDCDTRERCWLDLDGDGYGAEESVDVAGVDCALHPSVTGLAGDCDDSDPTRSPSASEVCGGGDEDCDDLIDDADPDLEPASRLTWFADTDGDGYGDPDATVAACAPPLGFVGNDDDCDDDDPTVSPGGLELPGDGVDQDCSGAESCYEDLDGDGWGVSELIESADLTCTAPGVAPREGDCDDDDATRNPAAREICGGGDEDCDLRVDEADDSLVADSWYLDADGDGDGDPTDAEPWCDPPPDRVATATDCDDTDPTVDGLDRDGDGHTSCDGDCDDLSVTTFPGAPELCDGLDQDCDGALDEGLPVDTWFADADGDGFGDPEAPLQDCGQPAGHVADATDCDDASAAVFPGAPPVIADGIDQDCDGVEECWDDADGDGYGSDVVVPGEPVCGGTSAAEGGDCDDSDPERSPGAFDIPDDGIDQNCDGEDASMGVATTRPDDAGRSSDEDAELPPGWFCDGTGGTGGWPWLAAPLWLRLRRRPR